MHDKIDCVIEEGDYLKVRALTWVDDGPLVELEVFELLSGVSGVGLDVPGMRRLMEVLQSRIDDVESVYVAQEGSGPRFSDFS